MDGSERSSFDSPYCTVPVIDFTSKCTAKVLSTSYIYILINMQPPALQLEEKDRKNIGPMKTPSCNAREQKANLL